MKVSKPFPAKEEVLTADFAPYDNFFPIATVALEENGRTITIPVIYTFFDASHADKRYFLKGEYGGSFSMELVENRCRPTFKKEALRIDKDYQEFLEECRDRYNKYYKKYAPVDFPPVPDWWQADDTPLDRNGTKLKFICQAYLDEVVDDDCRLYLFYDPLDHRIRNVYQRD